MLIVFGYVDWCASLLLLGLEEVDGSGDREAPTGQVTPPSAEVVVPSCLVFSRRMLGSDFYRCQEAFTFFRHFFSGLTHNVLFLVTQLRMFFGNRLRCANAGQVTSTHTLVHTGCDCDV